MIGRLRTWLLDLLKRVGGQEPWSSWSALSYLALGTFIACVHPSVRSVLVNDALLILFAGTAVFHFQHTGGHDLFDHLGMASALGAIALYAYGLNWLFVGFGVVGVPLLFVLAGRSGLKLHWLMGILVLGAFLALWQTHRYLWLGASFVCFAGAYWAHGRPGADGTAIDQAGNYSSSGDRWHAAWHTGAALGMLFLLLAGAS